MELESMWRRALADGEVTHHEAVAIYQYRRSNFAPKLTLLTTSMHVIAGIAGGSAGIDSPRVQRTMRERWQRLGLIVPFRNRRGGELPPAA